MKFSDILKAVRNAWAFAWPPVVALAVVFLIADFVSSFSTKNSIIEAVGFIREKLIWLKDVRGLLGEHGMEKVLQGFAGVMTVVALYLIKHVVLSLVGLLPPSLKTSRSDLLLRMLPEKETARLLRRYPGARDFSQAHLWAVAELQSSLPKPLDDPQSIGEVVGQLAKLGAVTAVVVTLSSDAAFGRMLLVLLICAAVWFGTAIAVLRDTEGEVREQWFHLRKALLAETAGLKREDLSTEEVERVDQEIARARSHRWWKVRLLDSRALDWIKAHLLNH